MVFPITTVSSDLDRSSDAGSDDSGSSGDDDGDDGDNNHGYEVSHSGKPIFDGISVLYHDYEVSVWLYLPLK